MITHIMPSSDTPKDELRQTYKRGFTESAHILARSNVRHRGMALPSALYVGYDRAYDLA